MAETARVFVVVEMSNGQMVEDVRLAVNGARPVEFLSRMGGNVPSHEEVLGSCANRRANSRAGHASRKKSRWPMSSEMIPEYEVVHGRAKSFYERFERKEDLQHQTHYCPAAATALCTRCWRAPSTSWAFRTRPF